MHRKAARFDFFVGVELPALAEIVKHASQDRATIGARNAREKCEAGAIDLRPKRLNGEDEIGGQFGERDEGSYH